MGSLKTQDIPVELRTWWKHFQEASYRHDYARVFDDWITMCVGQFVPPKTYDEEFNTAMRSYDRKEKDSFNAMFFEILNVFKQKTVTEGKPYYDMFGTMYEILSSQGKKASLGQFFTPECLVEMIVRMEGMNAKPGERKRILDPTCGSGRMLFIAHALSTGNFQYGIDIDQLCVKMTALNMMLHGCVGEVVCGNGLFLDKDWRFAFAINPILTHHGVPSIMKIEKDCSFVYHQQMNWLNSLKDLETPLKEKKKSGKKKDKVEAPHEPIIDSLGQLSIF